MIEPSLGTKDFKIGDLITSLEQVTFKIMSVEQRGDLEVLKSKELWLFVNIITRELVQITFFPPSNEVTIKNIGFQTTKENVELLLGKGAFNDGVFEPFSILGISFEYNKNEDDVNAQVSAISVYSPYPKLTNIPKHIKKNLARKIRLPK